MVWMDDMKFKTGLILRGREAERSESSNEEQGCEPHFQVPLDKYWGASNLCIAGKVVGELGT